MTGTDWWWTLATVLWVAGWVGMYRVWWVHRQQRRPTTRLLHTSNGPVSLHGTAQVLRHVRVVRLHRRPYDWATDGD